MDAERPLPVRSAVLGCLVGVAALIGLMLLVRPLIFTFAPPRDDSGVIIGSASQFAGEPERIEVVLSRSYGHDGEQPLEDGGGQVQLSVFASAATAGGISVVNAASPIEPDCPVELAGDRLSDCAGRTWAFDGTPIDPDLPPLQRFAARVERGAVSVDLTRSVEGAGG
jgi:hypothetical protein